MGRKIEIIAFAIDDNTAEEDVVANKTVTHFASETILAKDWLTSEEDIAWQNL